MKRDGKERLSERETSLELAKPKDVELALLRQAKGMAASSAPEAVSTLVDLMRNSKMDKIRLEAAKAILERGAQAYVRLYLPKGKPFCIHAFELYYTGGHPFPVEEGQL